MKKSVPEESRRTTQKVVLLDYFSCVRLGFVGLCLQSHGKGSVMVANWRVWSVCESEWASLLLLIPPKMINFYISNSHIEILLKKTVIYVL